MSLPHVRGQPQNLCFQVCFQRLNFNLNAWRHITHELVMSRVQNLRQRGNLNLPIEGHKFASVWSRRIHGYLRCSIWPIKSTCCIFQLYFKMNEKVLISHFSALYVYSSLITLDTKLATIRQLPIQFSMPCRDIANSKLDEKPVMCSHKWHESLIILVMIFGDCLYHMCM